MSTTLHNNWKLRWADWQNGRRDDYALCDIEESWIDASVPGDIHLDYLRAGKIPDPFHGMNSELCAWMEIKDWWYRTDFQAPEIKDRQRVFLHFEGLDTFATVYLNGHEIGRHDNMFTPLRIDITEAIRSGSNRLAVRLASPRYAIQTNDHPKVTGQAPRERLFARKAQACFGWDIAPRLVTCGLWRPVRLDIADTAEIDRVTVRTLSVTDSRAEVEIAADIQRLDTSDAPLRMEMTIDGQTVDLPCPDAACRNVFTIEKPKRWWPRGHGEPHLYPYALRLFADDRLVDETNGRCGIRTVELVREPLNDGESFCFKVNGKPIFLKGMNWSPSDALYARITEERVNTLLDMTADAHINTLRIWGGGYYETDAFYDRCDELGLMVWHDFMFACGCYPQDDDFLDAVRKEAEYHVKRLQPHPCMLAWCGDNENDFLATVEYNVPDYPSNRLTKELLPSIVRQFAPDTPYIPSSPFSATRKDQNADAEGDVHLWYHGTYYNDRAYLDRQPRMVSEIGHLALPDLDVIESFVPENERWPIWNDTWRLHSSDPARILIDKRLGYLFESIRNRGWDEPASLKDLMEKTQQLQAEATRAWIRHFASIPDCWGILLWNLADCWPQVSDAYIAYPLHPKPAWNVVKEEYGRIVR